MIALQIGLQQLVTRLNSSASRTIGRVKAFCDCGELAFTQSRDFFGFSSALNECFSMSPALLWGCMLAKRLPPAVFEGLLHRGTDSIGLRSMHEPVFAE
jgi:hypothetical protein